MKSKITLCILGLITSFCSFAQLDNIYDKGDWQFFFNYSSYTFNDISGSAQKMKFVKPFFARISIDRQHKWGGHFTWESMIASELIWGSIWNEDSEINDLDKLDQRGMSSGLIGRFNWTKNVVSKDDMIVAAGLEFGDYSVSNSSGAVFVAVGPSLLIEKSITNSIAVGLNIWTAKSVLQLSRLTPTDEFIISGVTARTLLKGGFFFELSSMFSNKVNGLSNSRFDLKFGVALKG